MDTLTCIKTRRSIRNFTDQEIPDSILTQILEAVRWAPSWANTQCWEVIVVKDQTIKEEIAAILGANYSAKAVIGAPVVMVMCALKDQSGNTMFDMGIASQNLCLAAHELGLGTVHVGGFNHARLDKLMKLPPNIETVHLIPVGYPARVGNAPPRKELADFVHLNHYRQAD
jgi:nitroreductase